MKSKREKLIEWIIDRFSNWKLRLENSNKEKENPFGFEDLTPLDNLDQDDHKEYFEALRWAISNKENIKNIAITGTYGSGKSSIIRTFEKNYRHQYKFLNISLASFTNKIKEDDISVPEENLDDSKNEISPKKYLNRLIERSILQQIFYKKKPRDIPQSRFKRIFSVSRKKTFGYSLLFAIWLFSIATTFGFELFQNIPVWLRIQFNESISTFFEYLIVVVAVVGFIVLIYGLFRVLSNLTFSKLNLTKGEIELAKHIDSSILNKHLDEIIYFFEEQKYDVVVIEDIDRYKDSIDIFTKLREMNTLLNQSEQVGYDVVFVYAIKDELFQDIEERLNSRTKFFDFIIPIIPVINSSNSEGILLKKFKKEIDDKAIKSKFISDISYFVEDMRVLKNIYNEFVIYRSKLSNDHLDQEKLLSIVIYKNLYPEQFSKLQLNKGTIFNVFSTSKKNATQKLKGKIREEISGIERQIDQIEKEELFSLRELRKLYQLELFKQAATENQNLKYVRINNNDITIEDLINEISFKEFKEAKQIRILNHGRNRIKDISFVQVEQQMEQEKTYEERAEIIQRKKENRLPKLKKDLSKLQNRLNNLNTLQLKDLFKELTPQEILGEITAKNSLLVYLLRNGYIDEMYTYYVSHFYEGALKREDFNFILSVKYHNSLPFEHPLTRLDEIIDRLHHWEFSQREILNYQLLSHLIAYESKYKKHLENFIELLSDESKDSLKFINQYIEDEKSDRDILFHQLCKKWHNIWTFIENDSKFEDSKKDEVLILIIKFAEIDDIEKINEESNGQLKSSLEAQENLAKFYDKKIERDSLQEVLLKLQVKMSNLDKLDSEHEKELLEFIFEENLYELNEHMITLMLEVMCAQNNSELESFKSSPYTFLMNSNCSGIITYVQKNSGRFVKKTLLKKDSISEAPGHFVKLLNNESIEKDSKERLVLKQTKEITDIAQIKDKTLWPILVDNSKVQPTWENVRKYYKNIDEADQFLVGFINKGFDTDKLIRYRIKFDSDEERMKFLKAILSNKEIKIKIRIRLITVYIDDISKDHVGELLNLLPYPYWRLNRPRKRPTFKKTDYNLNLIEKLKGRDFIKTFNVSEKSIQANVRYYVPGKGK